MGNVSQSPLASSKQVIGVGFFKTDVTNADGTLSHLQAANTEWVAPYGGSITGMGVGGNGTLTTGSLTFRAIINGVHAAAWSSAGAVLHIRNQYGTLQQDARKTGYQFNAGDRVSLTYTKTGTIDPETVDLVATVTVLLESVNF